MSINITLLANRISTGSLFRYMPGRMAIPIVERLPQTDAMAAFLNLLRHEGNSVEASIFWS